MQLHGDPSRPRGQNRVRERDPLWCYDLFGINFGYQISELWGNFTLTQRCRFSMFRTVLAHIWNGVFPKDIKGIPYTPTPFASYCWATRGIHALCQLDGTLRWSMIASQTPQCIRPFKEVGWRVCCGHVLSCRNDSCGWRGAARDS